MEVLAVVLLAVGDDRLRLAELVEHDDQLAALDLLDLAGEQLADLVLELVANPGPLALAHPLDDPLLGRLHRQAPEGREGDVFFQHVAGLELGILEAGLLDRDLAGGVLDQLDDLPQPRDGQATLQFVHRQFEADRRPVLPDQRRLDAVVQQVEQFRPIELLGGRQFAERREHFSRSCHRYSMPVSPVSPVDRGIHLSYRHNVRRTRPAPPRDDESSDGRKPAPGPGWLQHRVWGRKSRRGVKKNVGELPHINSRPRTGGPHRHK